MYDMSRMRALGKKRKRFLDGIAEIAPEIEEEIRAADRAGVAQVDIIEASTYSRNQVRLLSMTDEERAAERAKRRKTST